VMESNLTDEQVDIRRNLIAPCAVLNEHTVTDVDAAGLLQRLLLFNTYILQSVRFQEFPILVERLGYDTVIDLLTSGALRVYCDSVTIGQIGQLSPEFLAPPRKRVLPLGSYAFTLLRAHNREQYVRLCFAEMHKAGRLVNLLSLKQIIKLKRAILDAEVKYAPGFGDGTLRQLYADLQAHSPMINLALSTSLQKLHGLLIGPDELTISIHQTGEMDYTIETNLGRFGLGDRLVHKAVEAAVLGLSGVSQRIEEMKTYSALSGCIESESVLFMDKLWFLSKQGLPDMQQQQFQRVVQIAGVPEFLPRIDKLNVDRLMQVRESREAKDFRDWLCTLSEATDQEIEERVKSLRAKVASLFGSEEGKMARFVATTGLSFVNPIAGIISGVLDTFLINRIVPTSGVWSFIHRLYPSVFDAKDS